MKYITKGEPNIGSLSYKVDLTDDVVTVLERTPTAGDYVLYDKINQELVCVASSASLSDYPIANYTPIGIVVIPASHDVYGDGSCSIVSLKSMSCETPSTGFVGSFEQTMYWGEGDTDISGLPYLDKVPIIGNGSDVGDASSTIVDEKNFGYLPSDIFNDIRCPHDTDTYYDSSYSGFYKVPSPYLTDNSRNLAYYQTTSPSSTANRLSDFDGVGNTAKIIAQRGTKDYSSWKPTYNSGADYPVASCCNMFYTEGTQQGDWYLPACGELGYIMPSLNKIKDAVSHLRTVYGSSVGMTLSTIYPYWSSTEANKDAACIIDPDDGLVSLSNKAYNVTYTRAFLRAGGTSKISLKVI